MRYHGHPTPQGNQVTFDIRRIDECAQEAIKLAKRYHPECEQWAFRLTDKPNYEADYFSETKPKQNYAVIQITAYPVVKVNPKSVWIYNRYSSRKILLLNSNHIKFANTDVAHAITEFRRRKKMQLEISKKNFRRAEAALAELNKPTRRL